MAVYILMEKILENETTVVYKFGPDEKTIGKIEFNKETKKIKVLERVNDGLISNEAYEHWAIQKIVRTVVEQKGLFPQKMSVEH